MDYSNLAPSPARIKVIGVGGGGCNAVTRMVLEGIRGVEFIAVNTDAQALLRTEASERVRIGDDLTKGLGVGGDSQVGRAAAEESRDDLHQLVSDADMVFLAGGFGGGTGTGATPVIAEMAKASGALTIAIVTKPFAFEGRRRQEVAEEGIATIMDKVDTLIIIPNDRLLALCDQKALMEQAFKMADESLLQGVRAIAELITVPGEINLDFADVRAVMSNAGPAWMATGRGSGTNRALEAAKAAIASPLLDASIAGAKGVLFNVTGGEDLTLHEVNEAAGLISKVVDPEANIIFGVVFQPELADEVKITLIATGFSSKTTISPLLPDEEMSQLVQGLQDENEMDIPSFLRRPLSLRRRQVAPNTPTTENSPSPSVAP
jgi:cell division protein FtsZ